MRKQQNSGGGVGKLRDAGKVSEGFHPEGNKKPVGL